MPANRRRLALAIALLGAALSTTAARADIKLNVDRNTIQGAYDPGTRSTQYPAYDPKYDSSYDRGVYASTYSPQRDYMSSTTSGNANNSGTSKADRMVTGGQLVVDLVKIFTSSDGSFGDRLWSFVQESFRGRFRGTAPANVYAQLDPAYSNSRVNQLQNISNPVSNYIDPFWQKWCGECEADRRRNQYGLGSIFDSATR